MALEVIQSTKWNSKKAFNGFIYRREYPNKEETSKTTWRCTKKLQWKTMELLSQS